MEKTGKTRARGAVSSLILAGGVLFSPALFAGDLLDTYRLAFENDAEYNGALAANEAAREEIPQARALLLPEMMLDLSAAKSEQDRRKGQETGRADFTSEEMELTVTQPIYRKDRWIRLGQAKNQVKQAELTLALARQQLMIRVSERYIDVLRATDELAFTESERKAANRQLQEAQQRFEIGFAPITDVQEAQARHDLALAREIQAKQQLGNAYRALWEVTGADISALDPLVEEVPLVLPEPFNIDQWTRTALAKNLEVMIARLATEITEAEVKRMGTGHLPTLDLVGTHNRSSASGGLSGATDTRTSRIGLELNIPLYRGGLVLSQTREAAHLHSQAMDDLVRISRRIQRQTRDMFSSVVSGISSVKAYKRTLQSTQAALEAVKTGFQVGTRNSMDVLDAQREVFQARNDYADVRYDYVMDVLYLKQAAGTLSDEDLATVNGWLERR